MILDALHIEQPYSGEYNEKIYDIESRWNSSDWSWIKFEEENDIWCGEFRGRFRGVAISEKLHIVVVLTSDYMYVLDSKTAKIIDYRSRPEYVNITETPLGDILVTDGYSVGILRSNKITDIESIVVPIHPDNLQFQEYDENCLRITCYEFLNWGKEIEIYLDYNSLEWINF